LVSRADADPGLIAVVQVCKSEVRHVRSVDPRVRQRPRMSPEQVLAGGVASSRFVPWTHGGDRRSLPQ
jgi:hypothetical protein